MLSPPKWRRLASWICGWLFVVGNITITLAVNFGTTLFFVGCVNVFESAPGVGVLAGEPYQVFLIFLAITFLCNAVSALANRWLPWLDVRLIPLHPLPIVLCFTDCSLPFQRPPPSSGPLPVSLPSSSPSSPSQRVDVTMPNMSLLTSRLPLAGLMAGLSVLVCFTPVMLPLQLA